MPPTIETEIKRLYCVRRSECPGTTIRIQADTMSREKDKLVFKRGGQIVGEINNGDADWWIEEESAS